MRCTTCPNCGFDLERLERLQLDDLEIRHGSDVLWKGRLIALTPAQTLLVCATARAGGVWVHNTALVEAMGYEGDQAANILGSQFCKIYKAFRTVDPAFNSIERRIGPSGLGARWRVQGPEPPAGASWPVAS